MFSTLFRITGNKQVERTLHYFVENFNEVSYTHIVCKMKNAPTKRPFCIHIANSNKGPKLGT